ncbi:MAG: hypothetical protein C7B45_16745 [Sulfobacillus acidophilus]|uniref:MmgE/PrpD N-terminal domain-containing protein n=1 Tax=Sulfobacillus acidophilus TaxID=53633 RepID=A0A2T2WCU8_9FIRM|nr:MAG: hypothetical protein C7B45_16745 [Sulfobacillus acidophilus]
MGGIEYELVQQVIPHLEDMTAWSSRAQMVLADTVVVMLKGAQEPEIERLASALSLSGGNATLLAGDLPSTADRAAFVNATGGTFLELDEGVRPTGHPAIHLVPALLADTEERSGDASVQHLLKSLVLGYEVVARLAAAVKFDQEVHPHGHIGSVGVAAAVTYLRTENPEKVAHSMSVAGSLPLRTNWRPHHNPNGDGICTEGFLVFVRLVLYDRGIARVVPKGIAPQ